jgi:dCMP deaminase
MSRKWDLRFLEMATLVGSWSKDPSTKVGAVIADEYNRVVSVGYNGLPVGIADSEERILDRDVKLRLTVHAEHNAILFAQRSLFGCVIYTTAPPCAHCAAQIVQVGIASVISRRNQQYQERWADDLRLTDAIFQEAGVDLWTVGDDGSYARLF